MRAIILNGGKGSRLRPLTNQTPKAILPLNNRPFCLYQIDWLKKYGIREVTFAIGYLGDKIKKYWVMVRNSVYINYATENYPLDTAGAMLYLLHLMERY
jgi:mannose-1-phosphate guanylyltransferase